MTARAPAGYAIRPGRPGDAERLAAIEVAASRLFDGTAEAAAVVGDSTPPEDFREAADEGRLLVAVEAAAGAVGFALLERIAGGAHLDELDVLPEHGRRGVGSALVRAATEWTRAQGLPRLTLTTFREVPWNAPFYTRLGFRALDAEALPPALAELVRCEDAAGLATERRVVMALQCAPERA